MALQYQYACVPISQGALEVSREGVVGLFQRRRPPSWRYGVATAVPCAVALAIGLIGGLIVLTLEFSHTERWILFTLGVGVMSGAGVALVAWPSVCWSITIDGETWVVRSKMGLAFRVETGDFGMMRLRPMIQLLVTKRGSRWRITGEVRSTARVSAKRKGAGFLVDVEGCSGAPEQSREVLGMTLAFAHLLRT